MLRREHIFSPLQAGYGEEISVFPALLLAPLVALYYGCTPGESLMMLWVAMSCGYDMKDCIDACITEKE